MRFFSLIKKNVFLLVYLMLAANATFAEDDSIQRLLYVSSPDAAQTDGRSGRGLMVFDIDNGHKFVRRIDIATFGEGQRGLTGSIASRYLYFSTTSFGLGCFDLETDKVLWEKKFTAGCDRSCVSLDGKRIYAPTGWWTANDEG